MPCKHFQSALTDAAASGAPTPELRQHLNTCSDCHAAFLAEQDLFASIDSTLHAQANADIPAAFVSRVQARLAQEKSIPQSSIWIPSWAFAAVSAAIIFFAIVFPMMKSRQPHSDSPVAQVPSADIMNKTIRNRVVTQPANETVSASAVANSRRSVHSQNSASRASAARLDLPEVIVQPAERQAFAQFVVAVQRNSMPNAATVPSAVPITNSTGLIETALVHVESLAPQMEFTDFYGNTHSERQ